MKIILLLLFMLGSTMSCLAYCLHEIKYFRDKSYIPVSFMIGTVITWIISAITAAYLLFG